MLNISNSFYHTSLFKIHPRPTIHPNDPKMYKLYSENIMTLDDNPWSLLRPREEVENENNSDDRKVEKWMKMLPYITMIANDSLRELHMPPLMNVDVLKRVLSSVRVSCPHLKCLSFFDMGTIRHFEDVSHIANDIKSIWELTVNTPSSQFFSHMHSAFPSLTKLILHNVHASLLKSSIPTYFQNRSSSSSMTLNEIYMSVLPNEQLELENEYYEEFWKYICNNNDLLRLKLLKLKLYTDSLLKCESYKSEMGFMNRRRISNISAYTTIEISIGSALVVVPPWRVRESRLEYDDLIFNAGHLFDISNNDIVHNFNHEHTMTNITLMQVPCWCDQYYNVVPSSSKQKLQQLFSQHCKNVTTVEILQVSHDDSVPDQIGVKLVLDIINLIPSSGNITLIIPLSLVVVREVSVQLLTSAGNSCKNILFVGDVDHDRWRPAQVCRMMTAFLMMMNVPLNQLRFVDVIGMNHFQVDSSNGNAVWVLDFIHRVEQPCKQLMNRQSDVDLYFLIQALVQLRFNYKSMT